MSQTALAVRQPNGLQRADDLDTMTTARMLAESGFFGEVRDAGKALAKILAGRELGMGPIASLMGVYYQQGKVTYSANIMAAAIKKSGRYTYRVRKLDEQGCSLEFFERSGSSWESIGPSDFTIKDAEKAGLTTGPNKGNWSRYTRNMLFARAMSNGAKWYTPDVFGGVAPYTPDEFGDEVVMDDAGNMRPAIDDVTMPPTPRTNGPAEVPQRPAPAPEPPEEDGETAPDEPPAEPETVPATDTNPMRTAAIQRYRQLAALAKERKHPKADAINKVDPSTLDDSVLAASVKALEGYFPEASEPAPPFSFSGDEITEPVDEHQCQAERPDTEWSCSSVMKRGVTLDFGGKSFDAGALIDRSIHDYQRVMCPVHFREYDVWHKMYGAEVAAQQSS